MQIAKDVVGRTAPPRSSKNGELPGEQPSFVVYVIDDSEEVRSGLSALLQSVGYAVKTFETASGFLQKQLDDVPSCIISDIRLPGLSGMQLQEELAKRNDALPIIFMTGHGDIQMCAQAMKSGALEFLQKPLREQELLDATRAALEQHRVHLSLKARHSDLQHRYASLTGREREVVSWVITGRMNKQIAHEMKLSEVTVKVHRSKAMRALGARSVADLVRISQLLGVPATD